MIFLTVLALLILWAVIGTLFEVRRDGYGPQPTDWTRVAEHDRGGSPGPRIQP